jgi:hypothetical protein
LSEIDHGLETSLANPSFSIAINSTKVSHGSISISATPITLIVAEREKMRKNYIASLQERTSEEIAEEEALFIELKRLEQNERKFRKERDDLLRTLLGIDSGLPDIIAEEDGPSALSADGIKKKKKGSGTDAFVPSTPSDKIQLGPPITRRPTSAKSAVYGEFSVLAAPAQLMKPQMHNIVSSESNPP